MTAAMTAGESGGHIITQQLSGGHYSWGKLPCGARQPTAATHFQQTEGYGVGLEPGGTIREPN